MKLVTTQFGDGVPVTVKGTLRIVRSRFFTFIVDSLNMLEVRDRKKGVSRMS